MLIEATQQPIRYRLKSGVEVLLPPGVPTELPDEAARQLVKKAGSKVRVVERADTILIESATPHLQVVYFFRESAGAILGPARVDFATKVGEGPTVQYWLFVTYEGLPIAVNTTQLRSQREFETQVTLKPVPIIRESR